MVWTQDDLVSVVSCTALMAPTSHSRSSNIQIRHNVAAKRSAFNGSRCDAIPPLLLLHVPLHHVSERST